MKRKRISAPPNQKDIFSHQSESWLRASANAANGILLLLHAIERQQTPSWKGQRKRTLAAARLFKKALRWTKMSLESPRRTTHKARVARGEP